MTSINKGFCICFCRPSGPAALHAFDYAQKEHFIDRRAFSVEASSVCTNLQRVSKNVFYCYF